MKAYLKKIIGGASFGAMLLVHTVPTWASDATTLTTPTLFVGGPSGQNICVATNIGNSPITVTVEMVTLNSGTPSETCTLAPGDPFGCEEFANDLAYCRVTVQGSAKKVRAVMMNRSIAPPFTIFAAVDAR